MEEVDEVGEVDFGFDLASWMDDDDEEKEGEDDADPVVTDQIKNDEHHIASPNASGSTNKLNPPILKIQKPRAPMTPTIRKMLSESGTCGEEESNVSSNEPNKQANVNVVLSQSLSTSTSTVKTTSSSSGPASRMTGIQSGAGTAKTGTRKNQLGQAVTSGKSLPKAAVNKTPQKVPLKDSPSSGKQQTLPKKGNAVSKLSPSVTVSTDASKNDTENVDMEKTEKESKRGTVTRSKTRSSVVSAAKSTAIEKAIPANSNKTTRSQVKPTPVLKTTASSASVARSKPTTPAVVSQNLATAAVASTKSTTAAAGSTKATSAAVSSAKLTTAAVSGNKSTTAVASSKSTSTTTVAVDPKSTKAVVASAKTTTAVVASPKSTTAVASSKSTAAVAASTKPTSAAVSRAKLTAAVVSSSKSTTTVAVGQKSTAAVVSSTKSTKAVVANTKTTTAVVASPKSTASVVASPKSTLVASSKPTTAVAASTKSTTAGVSSPKSTTTVTAGPKSTAAVVTSTKSTAATVASTKSTTAVLASITSTTAVVSSTKSTMAVVASHKSTAAIVASPKSTTAVLASIKSTTAVVSSSNSTMAVVASHKSTTAIVASPKSTTVVDSTKGIVPSKPTKKPTSPKVVSASLDIKSSTPSPSPLKSLSISTQLMVNAKPTAAVNIKSTVPTAPSLNRTSGAAAGGKAIAATANSQSCITAVSSSSRIGPGTPSKSTSSKSQDDRASSPCIAEVMALDVDKDVLEDMDLGLTMSMKDNSDTECAGAAENNNKRKIILKKRPTSSGGSGPPDKKKKLKDFASKHVTSVKGSSTSSDSNITLPGSVIPRKELLSVEIKHDEKKIEEKIPAQQVKSQSVLKTTDPSAASNSKSVSKPTVKRIVRRFHRASQTLPKHYSSKLLQCLIRIPALDAPQQPKATVSVSANLDSEKKQTPYYVSPLPSTVRQEIFEAVSIFNTSLVGTRHIQPGGSFTHGISIGHITQADVDKSLFRENIVSKSLYYNFQFNGQDGVMDLYFKSEETFLTVMTQIRKTKIGPRHLPVTFFKVLTKDEQDPDFPQPYARAMVVFDQNFSSSAFLAYAKAQVWSKPKVEETFSVHNLPSGIPVDFLKQLIPDAITIDVEDEPLKFTQEGRRMFLGINRKTGDHVLKLFNQVYINQHCLILTRGRTIAADTPNIKEILEKQRDVCIDDATSKKLKASARDINRGLNEESKPEKMKVHAGEEIVMQVDDVPDAERVLVGRSSAWKGPSTVDHLKQARPIPVLSSDPLDSKCLSLVEKSGQDLSDISEGSDIGETPEDQESSLPARVGKSQSVRSGDMCSLSSKGTKAGKDFTHHTANLREALKGGGSKSHGSTNLDMFGRNLEMRDKFKSEDERRESSFGRNQYENVMERHRPGDLRFLISGHEDKGDMGKHVTPGWTAGKMDDAVETTDVFGRLGDGLRRSGSRRTPPPLRDNLDRTKTEKYSRYSPETEQVLLNRDKEKARALGRHSRSPSPHLDSKDRFKRLVEEKMRGLEGFIHGNRRQDRDQDEKSSLSSRSRYSREQDKDFGKSHARNEKRGRSRSSSIEKGPHKRKLRGKSPLSHQRGRRRSGSPYARRARGITKDELTASPPPFSTTGRKVTIVRRKSVSPRPRTHSGKGYSSLSPIKIGDDDDSDDAAVERDRVTRRRKPSRDDFKWLGQPYSPGDTATNSPSKIQSLGGRNTREEQTVEMSSQGPSGNLMPVSSSESDPEDRTNRQREILHEFVKQLLESANASSSTELDTSDYISTASANATGTANSSRQPGRQQMDYGIHSQSEYSVREYSHACPQEETKVVQKEGTRTQIPPPIPPPVLPPLFTPAPAENEKISQLESLAKQLAADIQRQQPQEQPKQPPQQQQLQEPQYHQQESLAKPFAQHNPEISGGVWAVPPPQLSQPPPQLSQPPPQLSQPPPQPLIAMAPPPHMMVAATAPRPPPMGFLRQPVVPLPFFTNMAAQIRLQSMGNTEQTQDQNANQFSDVNLNPHGKFF